MSGHFIERWSIDLQTEQSKHIAYASIINDFIISNSPIDSFFIDYKKESTNFFECLLSALVNFHIERLNLSDKNIHASFWTKSDTYDFNYIHTHIDGCDYESNVFKTQNKRPFLTCITFFDESNQPFIATDITNEMCNKTDFINPNNNHIYIEFPKILKHVSFQGGKYFHGEGYMNNLELTTPRKKIVIALWTDDNKPTVPVFDPDTTIFNICKKFSSNHCTYPYLQFITIPTSKVPIVFNPRNNAIKIIYVNHNNDINNEFFINLIQKKYKNVCFCLLQYICEYENKYDSFILDFTKTIIYDKTASLLGFNNGLDIWNIHNNKVIDDVNFAKYKNETVFDLYTNNYNSLEKYVYDLVLFHFKRLGVYYDNNTNNYNKNVYVSFYINSVSSIKIDTQLIPILTLHANYNNDNNISVITNLTNTDGKNTFTNSPIFITKNCINVHFSFNSKYNHIFSQDSLIINIWGDKPCQLNVPTYTHINYNNLSILNINQAVLNKPVLVDKSELIDIINDTLYLQRFVLAKPYIISCPYSIIQANPCTLHNTTSLLLKNKVFFDVNTVIEYNSVYNETNCKFIRDNRT